MARSNMRDLDNAELKNQLQESEEQMFRLRFQLGMGQTEGLKKYRELRRDREQEHRTHRGRPLHIAKEPGRETHEKQHVRVPHQHEQRKQNREAGTLANHFREFRIIPNLRVYFCLRHKLLL